ncbi:MAG: hypothetical protein ACRDIF_03130, partial [Actinomycetota bacterium]
RRSVADRRIRRLMVRDSYRARVFLERRLVEWGSDTLEFGARAVSLLSPSTLRPAVTSWMTRPATVAVALLALSVGVGMRDLLFGPPLAAGGLWPFPSNTGRLLSDYLSPWRDVGLGSAAAAPVAFPLLWLVSLAGFGSPHLAQVVLVVALVAIGLVGMSWAIRRRTASAPAQLVGVGLYALSPALSSLLRGGDLGGLALFAGLPFLLAMALQMLGPDASDPSEGPDLPTSAPEPGAMATEGARFSLVAALVVALAPSAYLALILLAVVLGLGVLLSNLARPGSLARSGWVLASLALVPALLLPWSLEALRPHGAILAPALAGMGGGETYGVAWSVQDLPGMAFLGAHGLGRAVVALVVLGALLLPGPRRRQEARRLVWVWLVFVVVGGLAAEGVIPAPVASPAMWMVVSLSALALLAGHLVAGIAEELPPLALGWRHGLAAALLGALTLGVLGLLATTIGGWRRPAPTLAANPGGELSGSISSYFEASSGTRGAYRILWLGDSWIDPVASGLVPKPVAYLLTGPEGLTMLEAFGMPASDGTRRLEDTLKALLAGKVHLAGHLLAPASIRFLAIDPKDGPAMAAMARQRDLALRRQEKEMVIFENLAWLPRSALAPAPLGEVAAGASSDTRALLVTDWVGGRAIAQRSAASFRGELGRTRHGAILLGDNYSPAWRARVGGRRLAHSRAFGWSNRFEVPSDAVGEVSIRYGRSWLRAGWLLLQAALLAFGLAMARSPRRSLSPAEAPPAPLEGSGRSDWSEWSTHPGWFR